MNTIYIIQNTINDKIYIGQTWETLNKRFDKHKTDKKGRCRKLFRAFNKHGRNNFYIKSLYSCNNQFEADCLEQYFIKKFDSIKTGYNIREGGSRGKHSEETKLKMSKAAIKFGSKRPTGYTQTEETKQKISLSLIGRRHTEEAKQKMRKPISEQTKIKLSLINTGKKHSKETKEKISTQNKGKSRNLGRKVSKETKEKLSIAFAGENNPNYGKTFSYETKQKLSLAHKGKTWKLIGGKRVWFTKSVNI